MKETSPSKKYTLSPGHGFRQFSFACQLFLLLLQPDNSSLWIACLSCNKDASAAKDAFLAEAFNFALTV